MYYTLRTRRQIKVTLRVRKNLCPAGLSCPARWGGRGGRLLRDFMFSPGASSLSLSALYSLWKSELCLVSGWASTTLRVSLAPPPPSRPTPEPPPLYCRHSTHTLKPSAHNSIPSLSADPVGLKAISPLRRISPRFLWAISICHFLSWL